jgi:hypothetical protein
MPKAIEVPGADTRRLIAAVVEGARSVSKAVTRFTQPARVAIAAFDGEVNPHHLDDNDYQQVVHESGWRPSCWR